MNSREKAYEIKHTELQKQIMDQNHKMIAWMRSIFEKLEEMNEKEVKFPSFPEMVEVKNLAELVNLLPKQEPFVLPEVQKVSVTNQTPLAERVVKSTYTRDTNGNLSSIVDYFSNGTKELISIARDAKGNIEKVETREVK